MQLTTRSSGAILVALVGVVGTARADKMQGQGAAAPSPPLPPSPAEAAVAPLPVNVHAAADVAGYADSDHVFVLTPSIAGHVEDPLAGWSVDGSYLVDVVSAASVDIVSTASKNYTEIRHAGTLAAAYQPGTLGGAVNASISSEPDYLSLGGGGALTKDLRDKNATLFLGFNHEYDIAGRTDTPFSVFSRTLNTEAAKAGLTLVLDRLTIASFIVDTIFDDGDPSKPYRYVPLFAPGTAVPVGASVSEVNALRVAARPLEQLPLSRQRYAGSVRLAHRYRGKSTLRLDERLYADSWALKATTTDVRYLVDVTPAVEIGPHVRLHAQTEVDFWERAYTLGPGFAIPALRTGDRELGPLLGATGGFSVRYKMGPPESRSAWVLGWDLNVTETHFLDDLYITDRVSAVSSLSLEANL